jgi:hypothetical protein
MKKFSNILNESVDIEEIEDYFLNINDALGEPTKKSIGGDKFTIYEFTWTIDINIYQYNDVSKIEKLLIFFDSVKELKTSQLRINDYDIEFKISGLTLSVRVTPKGKSESNKYKFFINQDWRETRLKYSEIIRFFKDKGYSVINIDEDEDEYSESSSVTIYTNANLDINNEFASLLEDEFEKNSEEIDHEFSIRAADTYISINPISEKTYITVVKQ